MIPKLIHYCWFGNEKCPQSVTDCVNSWKKFCPDYEIILWNESNYDINDNLYVKEAYSKKKYAFVSDYVRLDVVYKYGGVYLDTDVELINNLDNFLKYSCFFGMELPGRVATGLGFGSEKGNPVIKENLNKYKNTHFLIDGKENTTTCVEYTMETLEEFGIYPKDKIYEHNGLIILPPDYFCPYSMKTGKMTITSNTVSIHHYDASWYSGNTIIKLINKKLLRLKIVSKEKLNNFFGDGTYEKIKKRIKF